MHFMVSLLLVIGLVKAVDRNNFKTCNDSGFCRRQRAKTATPEENNIVADSAQIENKKFTVDIEHKPSGVVFTLEVTRVRGAGFRLALREKKPVRVRYEIPVGSSLVDGLDVAPLEVAKSEVSVDNGGTSTVFALTSESSGERLLLNSKPFRVDLEFNGKSLISVNRRGLLMFEPTQNRTGNETSNSDGAWEEHFKSHRDSKPHGPTSVGVDIRFEGSEHVYGIPEHADSLALKSTQAAGTDPYRLYNLDVFEYELNNPMALYGAVPTMYSLSANHSAGVFWHNPTETWIDVASSKAGTGTLSKLWSLVGSGSGADESGPRVDTHWFSEAGIMDLFLFVGRRPLDVIQQYTSLTGTTPLPPVFAIAYHQCRWNYNDETDLLGVESKFDEFDIPVDVLWLDIEHTDAKKYFTWDSAKFPDPSAMVSRLASRARKLVTVVDPHIKRDEGWNLYLDARKAGIFVKTSAGTPDYDGWCWPGSSAWPDFLSPSVRRWWAEQFLNYPGSRADNTFTWNDMGEPSVFNGPEVTMHKDAIHATSGGWEHREVHNVYGLEVHRATWEGQLLRSDHTQRPFVLTRAFFAGSQRFGAVWTGDNTADWAHLKASLPMVLSINIVGIALAGADVGGFFGNPDTELLTRWYQAAAFQPFFRAHAHLDTKRREPWMVPEEHRRVIRDAIRLRYALIPYWYTLFQESSVSGAPVMAPMWIHFPGDVETYEMEDQYLVGPGLLVKPVTDAGLTKQQVYLPGTESEVWYYQDGWQGFVGGQRVTLPVTLETIPYFLRGGHIIPRRERVRRSSGLARLDPYTLVVALDKTGYAEGRLYRDDEHSHRYRAPHSEFAHYQLTFAKLTLSVHHLHSVPSGGSNSGTRVLPPTRVERVVVLGLGARPRSIVVKHSQASTKSDAGDSDRRQVEFFFSDQAKVLVVRKPDLILDADTLWTMQLLYTHDEL